VPRPPRPTRGRLSAAHCRSKWAIADRALNLPPAYYHPTRGACGCRCYVIVPDSGTSGRAGTPNQLPTAGSGRTSCNS
jgi:hypothetical protein